MHLLALCACLWAVLLGFTGQEAKAYELKGLVAVLENDEWPEGVPPRDFVRSVVLEAKRLHALRNPIKPAIRFRFRFYKDPLKGQYNQLSQQTQRLYAIRSTRLNARLTRRADLVHYVVSPMLSEEGLIYVGGVALSVCTVDRVTYRNKDRISIGNMLVNRVGEPSFSFFTPSVVIVAHEIGHTIGMYHTDTPTLMHVAANSLWLQGILETRWERESVYDARACYESRDVEFPDPTAKPLPATSHDGCVIMEG
jgi:hypothetical protein